MSGFGPFRPVPVDAPKVQADRTLLRRIAAPVRALPGPAAADRRRDHGEQRAGHREPVPDPRVFDDALFPVDGGPVARLLWWLVAGLMVLIPMVAALIGVGQTYLTSCIGNAVMADLRGRLFAHLQRWRSAFFTGTKTGAIQSRLANDVGGVQTVLTDTASSILSQLGHRDRGARRHDAAVLAADHRGAGPDAAVHLAAGRVGRVRRAASPRRTQESLAEMSAITEETLSVSGVLLAKVFGRQAGETGRYREENSARPACRSRQTMTGQASSPWCRRSSRSPRRWSTWSPG